MKRFCYACLCAGAVTLVWIGGTTAQESRPAATQPASSPEPVSQPAVKPRFTYRLEKAAEPTEEQQKAYERITAAMDKAMKFYNENTVTIRKSITVKYSPGTPTADGSNNGTIRIGKYAMKPYVCMHEMAHTVGIGTSSNWKKLVVDHVFTGKHATAMLQELTGNPNAVLHADRMHFWPYGLNQPKEAKTDEDLIRHCKMVEAICQDLREAGKK